MATCISKTILQHLKKSVLQHRMKQHGREAEFRNMEGKDTTGAELLLVPPHSRQKYPHLCKYSLSQQGDKSLQR